MNALSFNNLALKYLKAESRPRPAAGMKDYESPVEGILRAWIPRQSRDGRIRDSLQDREIQYSTPAFALSAAFLAARGNSAWLDRAVRAMGASIEALARNRVPDGHGDFYTVMLMKAWPLLRDRVRPELRESWERNLRRLNPFKIYRDIRSPVHNWNALACCGEAGRLGQGLGGSRSFLKRYLPEQAVLLDPWGLYKDPGCPLAYDLFPRAYLEDGISSFPEFFRDRRFSRLDSAALASLFLQAPSGEWPSGGRSSHHQWNEAALAWLFETRAGRAWDRGEKELAGAYRGAGALALDSVRSWIKKGGGLHIVKNRAPDSRRLGFETYSHPSNYSLLAASHLASAGLAIRPEISALVPPAERGGFQIRTGPDHHKMVLNQNGWYVLMDPLGHPGYQAPGILKIQKQGMSSEKSWSEGFFPSARTGTAESVLPPFATGPAGLMPDPAQGLDPRLEGVPEKGWAWLGRPGRMVALWRRKGRVEAVLAARAASVRRLEITGWSRDGAWALAEPEGSGFRLDLKTPGPRAWADLSRKVPTARGLARLRLGSGSGLSLSLSPKGR